MMKMNNNATTVRVAINPLASFTPFVLKSILFDCPNKFPDRGIFKLVNHKETAMAGSSIISTSFEGCGSPSPASIMSSIYISAASFMFSSASCCEDPQLEQPGSTGIDALQRPSTSFFRVTFKTKVFICDIPFNVMFSNDNHENTS